MKVLIVLCLVAGAFARTTTDCPSNSHYEQCGSPCPLTCDNHDNPPPCILMCHRGCQCDEGYVEDSEGNCILIDDCPVLNVTGEGSSCEGDNDIGMCRGRFPKWWFDEYSGTCQHFIYGGCGGNGNRHATEEACHNKCVLKGREPHQNPRCDLPAATGECRAYFPRYYFNAESGQCEEFVYGGCRGNDNNFKTVEECQKTCGDPEGVPDPVHDCRVSNRSATWLWVECEAGYDGGLPQRFHLLAFDSREERLHSNVTTEAPSFSLSDLPPATPFVLVLYAQNEKGKSNPVAIVAETIEHHRPG